MNTGNNLECRSDEIDERGRLHTWAAAHMICPLCIGTRGGTHLYVVSWGDFFDGLFVAGRTRAAAETIRKIKIK